MLNGENDRAGVQPPGALPADEARELLATRILPTWTAASSSQSTPVVVLVAGQPGAGKTVVGDLAQAALERRGPVVRVCSDLYKPEHPRYAALLAADVRLAGVGVRADVRGWQAGVEEHVRVRRLDAVVETALADVAEVRASSVAYRAAGHRLELVVVATSPAASALGILDRYLDDEQVGGGRWVSWENHDACVAALLAVLAVVEDEHLVDRVTVVRRDHTVLFANHLDAAGAWAAATGAVAAVEAEHRRPWSARETVLFRQALAAADRRVWRDVADEDRRLAVQRDVDRAAALAEPVRRIAQPTGRAPGVDYHRLSAQEFRWIWDNLIVPGWLDDLVSQDDPMVTYVVGQPGAGLLDAARLVHRAMRHRAPVGIDAGVFESAHPDAWRLVQEDPRRAGQRVRADSQAWQRMAEAFVRERRSDLVIELEPHSLGAFRATAAADRTAGYRVELLVPAWRAADSWQHAAARYALVARHGPARYLDPAEHDACLAVLPDLVADAEHEHLVDAVTVIRRDHTAVYRNLSASPRRWTRPARAAAVLLAEQHRPYTPDEAARFAAAQRWLFREMPQYRGDLHEIAALARPLLPARWRPDALDTVRAAAALPARRGAYAPGWSPVSSASRAS